MVQVSLQLDKTFFRNVVDLLQGFVLVSITIKFKLQTYRSPLYLHHSGVRGIISENTGLSVRVVVSCFCPRNDGNMLLICVNWSMTCWLTGELPEAAVGLVTC